jgi:hypothetical protein
MRSPRRHCLISVKGSPSAESAAPVHGCPGSPCRAARVSPFWFAGRRIGRADAIAIESAIAARLAESGGDGVVRQLGVPACAAHSDRGVAVYLSWPRRLDLDFGRHHGDLTSAAPPTRRLNSWRGTSERCARTRMVSGYAAAGRPRRHPRGAGAAGSDARRGLCSSVSWRPGPGQSAGRLLLSVLVTCPRSGLPWEKVELLKVTGSGLSCFAVSWRWSPVRGSW